MKIQRPTQVDIRTAWQREDTDLTPWLAENLDLFEDVGLEQLDLIGTELVIPGFRRKLDILAETGDGRRVAIENQFRTVDHDHLTRGLAYAVGLEDAALVVIAEDHGDEFVATQVRARIGSRDGSNSGPNSCPFSNKTTLLRGPT